MVKIGAGIVANLAIVGVSAHVLDILDPAALRVIPALRRTRFVLAIRGDIFLALS